MFKLLTLDIGYIYPNRNVKLNKPKYLLFDNKVNTI